MTTYSIRITTNGRDYQTAGSVVLASTKAPVIDAAQSLLDLGASPSDMLRASFAEGQVSPVALHRLVRHYVPPRAAWGPDRDAERATSRHA
jgi:hypothetical protein